MKRVVLAALLVTGCGPQVRWGAETQAIETSESAPTAAKAAPKKMTAKDFAATFTNPRECALEAQRQYAIDALRGWNLIVACVERGDFTDLPLLVDGPWRDELATDKRGFSILADVAAARGGEVEVDVVASQERRFPLFSLDDAFEDPEATRGKLVLVRAVAKKKPKRTKTGKLQLEVKQLIVDGDAPERGAFESGRSVQLEVEDLEQVPPPGKLRVLLIRFEGLVEDLPLQAIEGEEESDDPGLAPAAQTSVARGTLLAMRVPAGRR